MTLSSDSLLHGTIIRDVPFISSQRSANCDNANASTALDLDAVEQFSEENISHATDSYFVSHT